MENKNLKVVVYLLTGMVGFGLGLVAVSLFLDFMTVKTLMPITSAAGNTVNMGALRLFDADWSAFNVSPAFVIISYVVLIVGLCIVAIDASIKQKLKRKIKGLNYAGLALTLVGFVLLIVSIIITKGQVEDAMDKFLIEFVKAAGATEGASDQELMLVIRMMISYDLGIGSIMAIIGGVIALIGSILLVIPMFDPIKLSAQPAPAVPAEAQPAPTEGNDNNYTIY